MKFNNWIKIINFAIIIFMVFHVIFPDKFILKIMFIISVALSITFTTFNTAKEENWFKNNSLFKRIVFFILVLILSGVFIVIIYRIAYFIGYSL